MLEIHDRCLEIYTDYLNAHSIEEYRNEHEVFRNYLLKSKELTYALKLAVERQDDDLITKAFGDLDQNRRNAHSHFGRAL